MPGSCVAPGCNEGYGSKKSSFSFFSAPKDPVRRAKWESAIPRVNFKLKVGHVLCEKHFSPYDITRKRVFKDTYGNIIAEANLLRPKLVSDDVVPTLFPGCPSYHSKRMPKPRETIPRRALAITNRPQASRAKRATRKSDSAPATSPASTLPVFAAVSSQALTSQVENPSPEIDSVPATSPASDLPTLPVFEAISSQVENAPPEIDAVPATSPASDSPNLSVFESVCSDSSPISVPIPWCKSIPKFGPKAVIYAQLISTSLPDGRISAAIYKEVCVDENSTVTCAVLGRVISNYNLGICNKPLEDCSQLIDVLGKLDAAKVCKGVTLSEELSSICNDVWQLDSAWNWRHKSCPYITDVGVLCNQCRQAKKSLLQKHRRYMQRQAIK